MLNVEELSLMRMFQAPAKEAAIRDIQRTIVVAEDEALRDTLIQLSEKLQRMTAEEYARLDFEADDDFDDLDIYEEDEAYGK